MEPGPRSLRAQSVALEAGEVSARELVEASLQRAEASCATATTDQRAMPLPSLAINLPRISRPRSRRGSQCNACPALAVKEVSARP